MDSKTDSRERRNILVLGASGMLGNAVFRVLRARPEWNMQGTQSEDSNAAGYMDVLKMSIGEWDLTPYDHIINCIGILKPAVNENDAASLRRAIQVNALFPHQL